MTASTLIFSAFDDKIGQVSLFSHGIDKKNADSRTQLLNI